MKKASGLPGTQPYLRARADRCWYCPGLDSADWGDVHFPIAVAIVPLKICEEWVWVIMNQVRGELAYLSIDQRLVVALNLPHVHRAEVVNLRPGKRRAKGHRLPTLWPWRSRRPRKT